MQEHIGGTERPATAAVLDVLGGPWAIAPETLQVICDIYDRHLRGEVADLARIETSLGRTLKNEPQGYTVDRRVAIMPVEGVISKRLNLFSKISGGVSTQLLQRDIQAALDDTSVDAILLVIDSPGGTVDGVQTAAQFVREAAMRKPMAALADGRMASGAYWLGSAVGRGNLFIADDTTAVGSIGVVAAHIDRSEAERKAGLKVTEITSGTYKRIASEHAPLTPEGLASIKEITDHVYTVFVNEVAENRGTTPDAVLADMADGRVFLGQKAIAAGLVDGISGVPALIAMLTQRAAGAGAAAPAPAPRVLDPVAVAKAAAAFQETEAAAGRAIDITAAVLHVSAGGQWPGDTRPTTPEPATRTAAQPAASRSLTPARTGPNDPGDLARRAQALVESEARAGRSVSIAEAVARLAAPRNDAEAVARQIQDRQLEAAREGRTISFADAAWGLGIGQ
jgi:signal peptide peptidase SppA